MKMIDHGRTNPQSPTRGDVQNPWGIWALAIVTLGVFAVVRHYQVNRELRDFGIDVDPVKALLAFFPGGLLLVPYLITNYRTGERIAVAQETVGLRPSAKPEIVVVAALFAFLHLPYLQVELNRAWEADSERWTP